MPSTATRKTAPEQGQQAYVEWNWETNTAIAPEATTTYTNDNAGMSQVLVADDGTTQTYNLFGLDLINQDDGTDVRYMLSDGLGSVRQELVGDEIAYVVTNDPFGGMLAMQGESGTMYGYTGEQEDSGSGLVYLRARYYDPALKVFLSRDPFSGWDRMPASQNGYSYSHNNPVNFTDPTGAFACAGVCIVAGGVVIVLAVAAIWAAIDNALHPGQIQINGGPNIDIPTSWGEFKARCWMTVAVQTMTEVIQRPGIQAQTQTKAQEQPEREPRKVGWEDDDWFRHKVLIVGDGDFEYSRALSAKHPDWKIIGTSFVEGGKNSQILEGKLGNLKLYSDVDATKLHGLFTATHAHGPYDAIIFNNPYAGSNGEDTARLISEFKSSAMRVLNPLGEIHINVTQKLLTGHYDVALELGLPDNEFETVKNHPFTFGQTRYHAEYRPHYSTGNKFRFMTPDKVGRLKNFVFPVRLGF